MEHFVRTNDSLIRGLFAAERELFVIVEKLNTYPLASVEDLQTRDVLAARASRLSALIEALRSFVDIRLGVV